MSYGNRTQNYSKMTVAQLQEEYSNALRAELQRKMEQIPRIVDEAVKTIVVEVIGKTLGVERDTWGKWTVKWHNRDHNLSFIHQIEEAAEKYVEANADKLAKSYLCKLTSEDTEQLKEDYRNELFSAVHTLMVEKANSEAEAIFNKLEGKKKTKKGEVSDD